MKNYDKLQAVLREIFEIDKADLDFGIYRIMNQKRDSVNKFIQVQLPKEINEILSQTQSKDSVQLKQELEELGKNLDSAGVARESSPKYIELQKTLEASANLTELEQEVFSHLTNFFKRYYNEGDFISQRRYKKGVYAIPYEGEEVKLHWANADQYYIKTSEYLKNYTFLLHDGKKVVFQLKEASTEQNNNKAQGDGERRFAIYEETPIEEANGDTLVINFTYELHHKSVKQEDLLTKALETISSNIPVKFAEICDSGSAPTEKNKNRTLLEKHLNDYVARNTFDYFIHKDLGMFLRQELDFYIKNEILYIDDINTENPAFFTAQLAKIKAFKTVADKIITFLAQIEDFQKKLWLKKKFVIRTDYCITMDKIPEKYYEQIFSNEAQMQEWENLFSLKCSIDNGKLKINQETPISLDNLDADNLPPSIKYAVLDTKFFSEEFKDRLMAEFYNLDEETNGLLINSENFQALNLMQEKYYEKVDTVYIDPPYNTEKDRQEGKFIYKDNFDNSSWLTLMSNRLELEKNLFSNNYSHFISIDENEMDNAIKLVRNQKQQYHGIFSWKRTRTGGHLSNSFNQLTDYVTVCTSFTNNDLYGGQADLEESQPLTKKANSIKQICIKPQKVFFKDFENGEISDISNNNIKIIGSCSIKNSYNITPLILEGPFTWTQEYLTQEVEDGATFIIKKHLSLNIRFFRNPKGHKPFPSQSDEKFIVGTNEDGSSTLLKMGFEIDDFDYPKPTLLLEKLISAKGFFNRNLKILDYFAGSGTTAHATIKLNREDKGSRKYILVEMGGYFDTVTKPRVQKVVYTDSWKDGKPQDTKGISQIFKYQVLESYEDTLNNLFLTQKDLGKLGFDEEAQEEYLLKYMLDVESREHLFDIEIFRNPFDYKLKVTENNELTATKVDLVETFNYLIGLYVEHVQRIKDIKFVEGTTREGEKTLVIWRNLETISNEETEVVFRKLFESERTSEFQQIYINGDHNLSNFRTSQDQFKVKMIEETFFNKMFNVNNL